MPLLWRDGARGSSFSWQRFALVWSAFVFAFFSFSSSKLATYIMPMLPPLALLGGTILDRLDARAMRRLLLPLAVTTTLLLAALLPGYDALVSRFARAPELIEPLKAFRFCLIGGIAAIAAGSAAAIAMLHRGNAYRALAIATVSAATVVAGQTFLIGFDAFRPLRSAKDLLSSAAERAPLMADAPFFQVELYDQTLPFYLRRTTTLVGYRDEFTFGIAAEPDKQIPTIDAFVPRWRALKDGYALVRPATFERFEREGIPMRVLAREPKRILVSRR
jgi:4-amino-4-deoxy-L-arabinose transferase-like glycosyltransferase